MLRRLALVLVCVLCLGGCKVSYDEILEKMGIKDSRDLILGEGFVVDFGTVAVGTEAREAVSLYGVSLSGYTVEKLVIDKGNDVFKLVRSDCGSQSQNGDEVSEDVCEVEIIFKPVEVKEYEGRVKVYGRELQGDDGDVEEIAHVKLLGAGGEVKLRVSPSSYDWDRLEVSDQGAFIGQEVTFSVSVVGDGSVSISKATINGRGFVVLDDKCADRELGEDGCELVVKPSIGKEGEYEAELVVTASDRFVAPVFVPLRAVAKYDPQIEVSPDRLELKGTIGQSGASSDNGTAESSGGATVQGKVTVKNTGFASVVIENIGLADDQSSLSVSHDCPAGDEGLGRDESCDVFVKGTFTEAGKYENTLVISVRDGGEVRVPITVEVVEQKKNVGDEIEISIQPASYDFGSVRVRESAEKEFVIENAGKVDVTVSLAVSSGGAPGEAFDVSGECPELKAGESCQVTVVFSPPTTGDYSGQLRVTATAVVDGESGSATATAVLTGKAVTGTWPASWAPYMKVYKDTVQGMVEYTVVPVGVDDVDLSGVSYRWSVSGGKIAADAGSTVVVLYDEAGTYSTSVEITGELGEYARVEFDDVVITESDEFGLQVRNIVLGDSCGRAPTAVTVTADIVNMPVGDEYLGTDFYVDGEKVLHSDTSMGTFDVATVGNHVVKLVGTTRNGLEAETYTVVSLVEGDAPECSVSQQGDGESSLILTANCTISCGMVSAYEWYVNGGALPFRGYRIDFSQQDLDQGVHYVVLRAYSDKGKMSETVWYNN